VTWVTLDAERVSRKGYAAREAKRSVRG
jgi:hypothetical protein